MNPNLLLELKHLADTLDGAYRLLDANGAGSGQAASVETVRPSLFEECIGLCRQRVPWDAGPIRTIHHLSCTGGTLITKCLAAMPNVLVLNEIDPLSTMTPKGGTFNPDKPPFTPTDIVSLLRQGDRKVPEGLLVKLFLKNLDLLRDEYGRAGRRLLLRDHSHSHFLAGDEIAQRPSLLSMVKSRFPVLSVVTVRHPIDSFLSLESHGWPNCPRKFEEYCRRYHAFLDAHEEVPVFRYEDFVNDPSAIVAELCQSLELSYSESFLDTFDVFRFSGDSGRTGMTIEARPRREVNEDFLAEVNSSSVSVELLSRLGYESGGRDA